jgi:GT2 family glycosyltransferase
MCEFLFEFILVDNGSGDSVVSVVKSIRYPSTMVLNSSNRGVAAGYNQAVMLARGDWILLLDSDKKMPNQWLRNLMEYATAIPETGVISTYIVPIEKVPDRIRGPVEEVNGLPIQKAMPMGAVFFRRSLLKYAGFFNENFGIYGWEHVSWGHAIERVCNNMNLLCYTIPGFICEHLDEPAEWKRAAAADSQRIELAKEMHRRNYPAWSPWTE